ncbi:MAG: dihydroorotate dehydrogenase [Deltaproteobacteria bacterium]|jgi:dihydroorotate dehydrogenase (NAD+) catalytic subunit|nr:dihydroorotate dehydrogenase [Deltaproteobacteria bacterium]
MTEAIIARATVRETIPLTKDTYLLKLWRPHGFPDPAPGQFVKIASPAEGSKLLAGAEGAEVAGAFDAGGVADGAFLGRPFSVFQSSPEDLSFLIRQKGRLTSLWRHAPPGAPLDLTGPLGRGALQLAPELFAAPAYLVGGGVGVAPFGSLGRYSDQPHTLIYGENSAESQLPLAFCRESFPFPAIALTVDGTGHGGRGYPTEALESLLREELRPVWACGPEGLLRETWKIARARGVPCYVSLESFMGCGLGVCLSCSYQTPKGERKRLCVDGPVARAEDWSPLEAAPRVVAQDLAAPAPASEFAPDLRVRLGPLVLKNPVIAASGAFGYGLELQSFCPPARLGAVIVKGLSLAPHGGNPAPRALEDSHGLINSIGLENKGLDRFLAEDLPALNATGATVGVNVWGRTAEDYALLAQKLARAPVHFLELNVSCPNLKEKGGLSFGANPEETRRLILGVREKAPALPLVVKLPPLVADIASLARASAEAGADALSLVNTLPALAVDLKTRAPKLGNVYGGFSGAPLKPLALRQTRLAAEAVSIPVIGLGGILSAQDALEFFLCGASAAQIGSAILRDPRAPLLILSGVESYLRENRLNLADFVGSLRAPL